MLLILIGFLLMFFDLNINGFDLLPDFLGYVLIFIGLGKLAKHSENFAKARPWALGMAIVEVVFAAVPLGLHFGPGLLLMLVSLYITYLITCGVADLEQLIGRDMSSAKLLRVWKIQAIFIIGTLLLTGIPSVATVCIGGLMAMVALAAYAVFLVLFNRARKVYEAA